MKIFVSGASDYIGNAVVSELSRRGHNVIALVKDKSAASSIKSAGAKKSIIGNLVQGGEWCDAIKSVDKVISLDRPAEFPENLSDAQIAKRGLEYTESITNLIKAAADGSAKGIVISYDTQCFGDRHGKWVEGDPGAVEPRGYCRPLEGNIRTIEETADASGLAVVSVYTATVYGNGGWFSTVVDMFRSGKAVMVGSGESYLNLIHVDDLATLYALIVEKVDRSDSFILSDSMPVTWNVFNSHLADLLDVKVPKSVDFDTCKKMFGLMAAESKSINTKTSTQKTLSVLDFYPKHRSYELGLPDVLKSMGIEPRAMEETMMKGRRKAA